MDPMFSPNPGRKKKHQATRARFFLLEALVQAWSPEFRFERYSGSFVGEKDW